MSEKRNKLEQIATDSVQRSGFHNLSFRTLANEVGVKSSSVHYYFPEKAHLATALLENYIAAFTAQLDDIDSRNLSLTKKLDAFIKIFEKVIKEDKLCLCGMMAAEVSALNKQNRILLSSYFSRAEKWISQLLINHEVELNIDIDPQVLSKTIMSGLEGAILIDRVDRGMERLKAQRILINKLLKK